MDRHRKTKKWTDKKTDRQTNGCVDRLMDRETTAELGVLEPKNYYYTDRQKTDRRTDGHLHF